MDILAPAPKGGVMNFARRHRSPEATMNRFARTLLLALLALVLVAGAAGAQMPVYQEGTKAKNETYPGDIHQRDGLQLVTVGRLDSLRAVWDGGVTVNNAEYQVVKYYPSAIQSFTISKQNADSSLVYPFDGCRKLMVAVYPTFDDSTGIELMGMRIRWHPVAAHDSLTSYENAWQRSAPVPVSNATVGLDTLGTLSWLSNKTNYYSRTAGVCFPDEYPLVLMPGPPSTAGRFYTFDIGGAAPYANYSVIMRAIACYNQSGAAYNASTTEPHITYRVDLFGLR